VKKAATHDPASSNGLAAEIAWDPTTVLHAEVNGMPAFAPRHPAATASDWTPLGPGWVDCGMLTE